MKINLLIIGFATGFISSFLGIGGGVFLVPALEYFWGYNFERAIGASLAIIAPIVLAGLLFHFLIEAENIKLVFATFAVLGSIIGAKIGANLANKIEDGLLAKIFSFVFVLAGLKLTGIICFPIEQIFSENIYPLLIVLGLAAGIISALFGIGEGLIIVPGLSLFFGFSMQEAIATSLAVIFPTTLAGALFHHKFNNIEMDVVKNLIPAALAGAFFGALCVNIIPSLFVEKIFGIFMILYSIKTFLRKN